MNSADGVGAGPQSDADVQLAGKLMWVTTFSVATHFMVTNA
jgi:hypothetical protein